MAVMATAAGAVGTSPRSATPSSAAATGTSDTIVAALPFVLVMIALCVALVKDLRSDPLMVRRRYGGAAVEQALFVIDLPATVFVAAVGRVTFTHR